MGSGFPNLGGVGANTVPLRVVSPPPGQVIRRVHRFVHGVPGAPPAEPSGGSKPKSASGSRPVPPPVPPGPPLPPVGLSPPPPLPPAEEILLPLPHPSAAAASSAARRKSSLEVRDFTQCRSPRRSKDFTAVEKNQRRQRGSSGRTQVRHLMVTSVSGGAGWPSMTRRGPEHHGGLSVD